MTKNKSNNEIREGILKSIALKYPERDYPLANLWAEFYEDRHDHDKDMRILNHEMLKLHDKILALEAILKKQAKTIETISAELIKILHKEF